jgi:FKBP-type peptidyl-prolyl cis-trans isomerase
MRKPLSLMLVAGLSLASFAFAADPAQQAQKAGQDQPGSKAEGDALPPRPNPNAVPVPTGEVVNKQELEGGLIIEDIKIGDGYEVKAGGAVVAHYHGTLKEGGKIFDSSFDRGEPVSFPLNGVIEGWQKGVPGMKIGGIRKLTIPAKMGYGERGAGATIPPNSDLVFTIQLVDALQIIDEKEGSGEAAEGQCVAVTAHVIKDAEGKEVEKHDAANPYIWIPGELQAMQFGFEGMKVGGKRKLIVPKQMNQANPQAGRTLAGNVPITVEMELIALRNLGPKKAK